MAQVLGRKEILSRLTNGDSIIWWGDREGNHFWFQSDNARARSDTMYKLLREDLITSWGYPQLNGEIYLKREARR